MSTDRIVSSQFMDNARHYEERLANWLGAETRQTFVLRLLYMLLAVNLCLLGLYLFHGYVNYFHTDASTKNLLAQEMWETGQFFPRDWNYVNRDLMVVFGQLLIWPLLAFFRNGFALHAFAGLLVSAALLGSIWKLTAILCAARWQRVMVIAVLAGGLSQITAENIFGQTAYGTILLLTTIVVLTGWWALHARDRRLHVALAALALVLFLATWSNPQRALISYVIPLLAAICVHVLWGGSVSEVGMRLRRGLLVSLLTAGGILAGAVCSAAVLAEVQNNITVAGARWLDFDGVVHNLKYSAPAVMTMFGGIPPPGTEVASIYGIYAALRLLAAVSLLVLLPWAIAHALQNGGYAQRFFGAFVAVQLFATLFLFVTTTLPDMGTPLISGRYLAPGVLLGLVLLFSLQLPRGRPFLRIIVVGLMCVLVTNSLVRAGNEALPVRRPEQMPVVDALRGNKLQYGYATYWNSGVNTVLSAGDSKVRQISIVNGLPMPMRHLGSNRWYEASAWDGPTFLLLSQAEEATVDWGTLQALMGAAPTRIQVGHLAAFVYPANLAEKLPHWSRSFTRSVTYPAFPGTMRTQGTWDEASKAVVSARGEAGFLVYGPYTHLPAGRYRAEFGISSVGAGKDAVVAVVDVVHDLGSKVVASLPVHGSADEIQVLEFQLPSSVDQLEMRVQATGAAELTYRGLTLHPLADERDDG